MKGKKHLIFILLIALELITLNYYYWKEYGTQHTCALLNPFCLWNGGILTTLVMVRPHPLFYLTADIIISTIAVYFILFLYSLIVKSKKKIK